MSDPRRNSDLRAIHAMAREIGMDEDAYRALACRVSGGRTTSSGNMRAHERRALLDELRRLGGGRAPRPTKRAWATPGRVAPNAGTASLLAKIAVLWEALWHLGEIDDPSAAAMRAWIKRQTGCDAPAWLTVEQCSETIEALRGWCGRAGWTPPRTSGGGRQIAAAKQSLHDALVAKLHGLGCAPDPDQTPASDGTIAMLGRLLRDRRARLGDVPLRGDG